MEHLTNRINAVDPSPTLSISAKAGKMRAKGLDVLSFSAGEPDFNTPAPIRKAAKKALDEGKTKYTPTAGIPELRKRIAKAYEARGRNISAENVQVTVGGKQALYNAMQTLFESGDKVLIPAPYWVSYPAQVKLAEATPTSVECPIEDDFKLTPAKLEKQLQDSDVTGLILCSPSNPTGSVYSEQQLRKLGDVLKDHPDVSILFDAIYDRLYYGHSDYAPDLVDAVPELEERVITFNGFSKTYAMTGWRLGYAISSTEIIDSIGKLQSHSTSNATSFVQYGALAAFDLAESVIEDFRETFKARRDLMVEGLREIPGFSVSEPDGAFYVFPNVEEAMKSRFESDFDFVEYLLDEALVAGVPGSAFGTEGYLRLSYAVDEETIQEGIRRIRTAVTS